MALEITKRFEVRAPVALVWDFLVDPERVARCLPGAAITGKVDDKTYTGTMNVKVGPVGASYRGKISFESLDPVARKAEIVGSGQETRGKGGADLRLTSTLREAAPGVTEVTALSVVNVSGILAQMGRGMIQDVSDQMFQIFSDRMRSELEAAATKVTPAALAVAAPAPAPEAGTAQPTVAAPVTPSSQVTSASPLTPSSPVNGDSHAAHSLSGNGVGLRASAPFTSTSTTSGAGAGAGKATALAQPEALDLGAVGFKVAGKLAGRVVRSPVFWFGIVVGIVLDRLLFR